VHSVLGSFYSAQGNLSAAESEYKAAFDLSPVRSARRLDYIDFKVRNGDIAAAKKLLEETVQKAPDHLPTLNRLAELTLGEKNFTETSALLRKVLSRDPQNFEGLLTQGLLHLAEADSPKAIAHFEKMASVFTAVPKVRYHLALAFFATNNTAEAVKNLDQAIGLDPEYTDAILLLAEIQTRKGDSSAAIASLSSLIRKQPSVVEAHLLLAMAHRVRNDLDAALGVYSGLAELFPKNAQVRLLIGGVLLQQNKTNEARAAFEKAIALAPNYLPALEQVIALDLAQKQFLPAVERIQKELERNPNAPELHILLAKAYYEKGDTNTVEKTLLRAVEIDPAQREPYVLLARLYTGRKERL
jgi:Tfp pilus assembly protein PilF